MILCKLFLVSIILGRVPAQICNGTKSVLRYVPETYRYTYYEAYEGQDCLIWCIKSKQAVNVGIRQVEQLVNETVAVCCEGYIEDDSYEGAGLKCVPLCNPACDNGYCKNPNECACEPGYAIDPNVGLHRCIPLCLEGCSTPDCLSTCNAYEEYDTSESDMCYDTCLNGTCVAPGVCHCDPGYRRVFESCEPVCSSCEHGSCVAPENCECDFGWREECGSCQPFCSGCEHGTCKAPGQCECDAGYKAENAKCVPHCVGCNDGNCIAPNVCVCNPGWYLTEDSSECLAHCDDCSDDSRKCDRTCGRKSNEDYIEGVKESELFSANSQQFQGVPMSYANLSHIGIIHINNSTSCNINSLEFSYHWIYAGIILLELLVIICMLVIMKRKHLLNRLKIKKCIPQDKPRAEVAVHYTSSVTCSKIKEMNESECA